MKPYIYYIIITGLVTALFLQCENKNDIKGTVHNNYKALTDTVQYYKNKLGTTTASIHTLQTTNRQLQQVIKHKDKELAGLTKQFNNVKNITRFKSNIQLEPVSFSFSEPLYPHIAINDTIRNFTRKGFVANNWYNIGYTITNDSLTLQPISTWTETTIITGFKRKWFLGRQTLVTDITNSNPYITVTTIEATDVVVPEQWYKKWYVWLAAGFITGIAVTAN